MLHATTIIDPSNYAKGATYEPGYEKCEKLLPTLLTIEAAGRADYKYHQEQNDNAILEKISGQLLPKSEER